MISTARVGGERLVYVGGFGPRPGDIGVHSYSGTGLLVSEHVRQAIDNAGGRPEHILYHDQYEPGQVIFTAYIPTENLVSFAHEIGGDKRIKTLKRAMAWFEQRKHVIDLVRHWADKPVGSRNGYKPLVTARVSSEVEPETEHFIAVILPLGTVPGKSISEPSYKLLKSLVAKIMSKGKVSKYNWMGSLTTDIGVVSCTSTDTQLRRLGKAAKSVVSDVQLIITSNEDELRKKATKIAFDYTMKAVRQNGFAQMTNVVRADAPLTALSVIEARVAGEKQNAIDVAWNIGGNSQGWSEASLKKQVDIAKSRAKDKGLFNVRLLGYWKNKRPGGSDPTWLDAVLVAKLPTDDPKTIVGVAFFFDVDLESDDDALEKINDETELVIEKVKRNQTYFSYRGSYVLGEFEKD